MNLRQIPMRNFNSCSRNNQQQKDSMNSTMDSKDSMDNKDSKDSKDNKDSKDYKQEFKFPKEEQDEGMQKEEKQRIGWAVALGLFSSYLYLGWGDYQNDNNILVNHNKRAWESIVESYEYFMHPPKKALLPPLPKSLHRDFTLCVELSDVLTHLVWEVPITKVRKIVGGKWH